MKIKNKLTVTLEYIGSIPTEEDNQRLIDFGIPKPFVIALPSFIDVWYYFNPIFFDDGENEVSIELHDDAVLVCYHYETA